MSVLMRCLWMMFSHVCEMTDSGSVSSVNLLPSVSWSLFFMRGFSSAVVGFDPLAGFSPDPDPDSVQNDFNNMNKSICFRTVIQHDIKNVLIMQVNEINNSPQIVDSGPVGIFWHKFV